MSMLLIDVAPRSFVAQHGIEDGQKLARHRVDRDEFRLAGIAAPPGQFIMPIAAKARVRD